MNKLSASIQLLDPTSFWRMTRWGPLAILCFGLILILVASAISLIAQLVIAGLLIGAVALGFLVRSEIALLTVILAGFVVIVRYAEGFQPEEVVYGLVYLSYLGYWFVSRTLFYRDSYLRTPVDFAIFLFLIYVTGSIVLTPILGGDMRMALSEWSSLSMLAFYFPIKEICTRHRERLPQKPLLIALCGIALFVAIRNLFDYRRGLSEADYLWQIATGRVVMNEHVLMMAGLVTIVFLLYSQSWRERTWLGLLSIVFAVGVIIGQSRAVWLSFILGMAVIFLLVDRKSA